MRKLIGLTIPVAIIVSTLSAAPAMAQNNDSPGSIFVDVCSLAGGTASKNWPTTRLTCRFNDGSIIWCTPSLGRCGHTKARTKRAKSKVQKAQKQLLKAAENVS